MIGIGIFGLIIIPSICIMILSLAKPPSWLKDSVLFPHWFKINMGSLVFSIILAAVSYFLIHENFIAEFKIVHTLAISLLTFIFGQTIFTDGWLRLADRRILRIANVLSLICGIGFLLIFGNQTMIMIYILMFLLATVIVFLPMIGTSDGRAIQLIVLATYPTLGLDRMQWGIIVFVPVILIYGLVVAIKNKNIKGIFTKISVPMVPLMLAPFILVLMLPVF